MSARFLRRLGKLHRLLWMDERVANVESQLDRMREQSTRAHQRLDRLHYRQDRLYQQLDRATDQLDFFKSSLEVPPELIEEFLEWKAQHPIPKRPLVSVIIATYNRPGPLMERCIPSVLGQTYENLELIVVGDGCTDETEELVNAIEDPRLSFINLPERSSYPADPFRRWMVVGVPPRNRGLAAARGEFITYLDDDDEYTLDRLDKLVRFASEEGCDLVWHPFWIETGAGEWALIEARRFAHGHVTTSSVFYRSWFKKILWNLEAHLLMEPDDWNLFRRIKYVNPVSRRYPNPLYMHYEERSPDHSVSDLWSDPFDAMRRGE